MTGGNLTGGRKNDMMKKDVFKKTKKRQKMTSYDIKTVLALPLGEDTLKGETIRQYLGELLFTFWTQGEHFDPERPHGYKGWEYDLHYPLVKAGLVQGTFTHYGSLAQYDVHACDVIITRCILEMMKSP